MKSTGESKLRRPSAWWLVLAALCVVAALASGVSAYFVQRQATRPVGEGVVFVNDAAEAGRLIDGAQSLSVGVRAARNTLEIEAVSVVNSAGVVLASTSESLVGTSLSNELLLYGVTSGRFTALAGAIPADISIDGIEPAQLAGRY